jgi:hypothetical protein
MKQLAGTIVAMAVLAACAATPGPTPSLANLVPSLPATTASASPTSAPILTTAMPTVAPGCVRQGSAALAGVVEALPKGWSYQGGIESLPDFPKTYGRVYGPKGVAVPPFEGPGRLTLYETLPASGTYFKSRIDLSRDHGGKSIAVTVCGEATVVWMDESTGELVVGWTDRDKSDVLVANMGDVTVAELVDYAESVYDCCG